MLFGAERMWSLDKPPASSGVGSLPAYIHIQYPSTVNVCSSNTCMWGEPCCRLICRCSEEPFLTSCLNGFFLQCSPPTPWRPEFNSRPVHISPGTSSLGWRWPWSSLSIIFLFLNKGHHILTRIDSSKDSIISLINNKKNCQSQRNIGFLCGESKIMLYGIYKFVKILEVLVDKLQAWK